MILIHSSLVIDSGRLHKGPTGCPEGRVIETCIEAHDTGLPITKPISRLKKTPGAEGVLFLFFVLQDPQ